MTKVTHDELKELVRCAVLKALDDVLEEHTGKEKIGWKDHELPELFKALDVQTRAMAVRADIPLDVEG